MKERTHRSKIEDILPVTVDTEQLAILLNVGLTTAVKIAEMAQARVDFGSSTMARFNVDKIMKYVDEQSW